MVISLNQYINSQNVFFEFFCYFLIMNYSQSFSEYHMNKLINSNNARPWFKSFSRFKEWSFCIQKCVHWLIEIIIAMNAVISVITWYCKWKTENKTLNWKKKTDKNIILTWNIRIISICFGWINLVLKCVSNVSHSNSSLQLNLLFK